MAGFDAAIAFDSSDYSFDGDDLGAAPAATAGRIASWRERTATTWTERTIATRRERTITTWRET